MVVHLAFLLDWKMEKKMVYLSVAAKGVRSADKTVESMDDHLGARMVDHWASCLAEMLADMRVALTV